VRENCGDWQVMDDRWESEVVEFGAINVTGFRMLDRSRRYVQNFMEGWKSVNLKAPAQQQHVFGAPGVTKIYHSAVAQAASQASDLRKDAISATAALVYDAVMVLIDAIKRTLSAAKKANAPARSGAQRKGAVGNGSTADCDMSTLSKVSPWELGEKISLNLRKVSSQTHQGSHIKPFGSILQVESASGRHLIPVVCADWWDAKTSSADWWDARVTWQLTPLSL